MRVQYAVQVIPVLPEVSGCAFLEREGKTRRALRSENVPMAGRVDAGRAYIRKLIKSIVICTIANRPRRREEAVVSVR